MRAPVETTPARPTQLPELPQAIPSAIRMAPRLTPTAPSSSTGPKDPSPEGATSRHAAGGRSATRSAQAPTPRSALFRGLENTVEVQGDVVRLRDFDSTNG